VTACKVNNTQNLHLSALLSADVCVCMCVALRACSCRCYEYKVQCTECAERIDLVLEVVRKEAEL
jgi:hypothetical protein